MDKALNYIQLSSLVNPSFWNKFTDLKLDVDKLRETEHSIWGYFPLLPNKALSGPCLEVDSTSFNVEFNGQNMYIPFEGKIANKNTIEQFKECDKMDLLNNVGEELYGRIVSGEALKQPSILNYFLVVSYADLKKYHYYYWFAFPVPYNLKIEMIHNVHIGAVLDESLRNQLCKEFRMLQDNQKPYFLLDWTEHKLYHLEHLQHLNNNTITRVYFVFFNISNTEIVGSSFRNFMALISHYCPYLHNKSHQFIALQLSRENSQISINQSRVITLNIPEIMNYSWVGWEKNERDKLGPKMANMKNTLDPQILAENAVDLNLKLMKWRLIPNIDLEKLKLTKCLLLGSGTLGSSVARCLLGWGIRDITFIDNSTVSFSNPVRQSLFTYEDSVKMRPKAEAAAYRLKKVFPGVKSKGIQMTIPMPGHNVGESMLNQIKENVDNLTTIIKESDVIFLLMDSRESRWLPTMLGNFFNKVVINAALGFDSYLIMRHGCRNDEISQPFEESQFQGYKVISGSNLGCYFCNDVTAPGDSLRNRTLDQQCTVTRPGVSQIAGALAVELMVSILQDKNEINAPAFYQISSAESTAGTATPEELNGNILGMVPHSIRGFLSNFSHILPATMKYNQCVACSKLILDEYEKNGFEFLLKVFNSSKYLEDVTKLSDLMNTIDYDEILELSDISSD